MNILLISPLGFAINEKKTYAGIEMLVWEFSRELNKNHEVTVLGHVDSVYPEGVTHLSFDPTGLDQFIEAERKQYQAYQYTLRQFDVIHDFSHQHFASRFNHLPTLNIFWHAPQLAQYPKAPYNIIALSKWAAREYPKYYKGQQARYQQSIILDTDLYVPGDKPRNDRFFTFGRMSPEKGNLRAAFLCSDLRLPLDVAGGRGVELEGQPLTRYEQELMAVCNSTPCINFRGPLNDEHKIGIMQTCKALIYMTDHPEVTSHKIQETMLCGAPVIVPHLGALPEIVTHGVDGFLCRTEEDFYEAVQKVGSLTPSVTRGAIVQKYGIKQVIEGYLPLYEEVASGLRW